MEPNARIEAYVANYAPVPWTTGARRAYASFWRRLFALILDTLMLSTASFAVGVVVIGTSFEGVVFFPVSLAYFGLLDALGGTLGKRVFSIRAVAGAAIAPGLMRGFPRHPFLLLEAAYYLGLLAAGAIGNLEIALLTLLFGLLVGIVGFFGRIVDGLWMLGDPHRQTLHDKLAGTYVVEV